MTDKGKKAIKREATPENSLPLFHLRYLITFTTRIFLAV